MIFKIEGHWIQVRDCPTIKEVQLVREGEFHRALSSFIVAWDFKKPINEITASQLNYRAIRPIIDYLNKTIEEIANDANIIDNSVRTLIINKGKVRLFPESRFMIKYSDRLRICMQCIDSLASLRVLPSGNTVDEIRFDDFLLLEAIVKAKNELSEMESNQRRR